MLTREAVNNSCIVFCVTRSGLEPTIYRTQGELANHHRSSYIICTSFHVYNILTCINMFLFEMTLVYLFVTISTILPIRILFSYFPTLIRSLLVCGILSRIYIRTNDKIEKFCHCRLMRQKGKEAKEQKKNKQTIKRRSLNTNDYIALNFAVNNLLGIHLLPSIPRC